MHTLNAAQQAAVTYVDGPLLVLAGAGSGKTRVITQKIAYLIRDYGIAPSHITAITFTNKAAKEMVARLSAMLPVSVRGMWIGTFHGLCNRLLRAHHKAAGLAQSFQILDTQDQQLMIHRLLCAFRMPIVVERHLLGRHPESCRPQFPGCFGDHLG